MTLVDLQRHALADSERLHGVEHPDTLRARSNLAAAYQATGRIDDAIALHAQVLDERERVLGADHPDTLNTRHHLAVACWAGRRKREAIAVMERVVMDSERILGPADRATRDRRAELVRSYRELRLTAKAVALEAKGRRAGKGR